MIRLPDVKIIEGGEKNGCNNTTDYICYWNNFNVEEVIMIDKNRLIMDLRYSSQWNAPCPEWVFKKIEAMEDLTYEDAIDRYEALAILHPLSVEYKEMKALPPVQPKIPTAQPESEERMAESAQNVPNSELISKKAAIDAVNELTKWYLETYHETRPTTIAVIDRLTELPSVQPERLTDKEQRIFLAAMGREEKVCKEVDDECIREPYEDSLVRVCSEIERKVKGALWT